MKSGNEITGGGGGGGRLSGGILWMGVVVSIPVVGNLTTLVDKSERVETCGAARALAASNRGRIASKSAAWWAARACSNSRLAASIFAWCWAAMAAVSGRGCGGLGLARKA